MANDNIFFSQSNKSRDDVVSERELPRVERSAFPMGCERTTLMNEGALIPVDSFFVLPGDSFDIEQASLLSVFNPFVDRMFSGMRLYFHWYYQKCEHEWKGWKNYATRGRRGNVSLQLPFNEPSAAVHVLLDGGLVNPTSDDDTFLLADFNTSSSLCSYLTGLSSSSPVNQTSIIPSSLRVAGVSATGDFVKSFGLGDFSQVNRSYRAVFTSSESVQSLFPTISNYLQFNAIKFSMYQRIYRDFYLNQNLCHDNPWWFPDDEDDFCLPYSGGQCTSLNVDQSIPHLYSVAPNNYSEKWDRITLTKRLADTPVLAALRYRQWDGDIFTTAVPFLERNGTTQLRNRVLSSTPTHSGFYGAAFGTPAQNLDIGLASGVPAGAQSSMASMDAVGIYGAEIPVSLTDTNGVESVLNSVLNFNQLRELAAATAWSERNARADGDYNSMILSHYAINPRSEDRAATYIGGSMQRVEFSEVLQTSESGNTPLGSQVARAYSGGSSRIGHFEVPDFGFVMCIASLVPDTFYTQGMDFEDDPLVTGADLPWPEFSNMQKEGLPRKRLYYSGNRVYDDALFGYIERDLLFKYRRNKLIGPMTNFNDTKIASLTFARQFGATGNDVNLNNEFVTMTPYTMRSNMYSVPSEPHFVLQFGTNIRMVRALPYVTKDSSLTNIL